MAQVWLKPLAQGSSWLKRSSVRIEPVFRHSILTVSFGGAPRSVFFVNPDQ